MQTQLQQHEISDFALQLTVVGFNEEVSPRARTKDTHSMIVSLLMLSFRHKFHIWCFLKHQHRRHRDFKQRRNIILLFWHKHPRVLETSTSQPLNSAQTLILTTCILHTCASRLARFKAKKWHVKNQWNYSSMTCSVPKCYNISSWWFRFTLQ